ncbi:MAG: DUF1800 domain-containing protein, partial [Burkholderiaceae bacterium]|nr:DUF1800 domain-containing protein [Burkholderiaceae bacterium]
MQASDDSNSNTRTPRAALCGLIAATFLTLAGCGGGGGGGNSGSGGSTPGTSGASPPPTTATGGSAPARPAAADRPSAVDAARLLTQATFGIASLNEIETLRNDGYERWLWTQFNTAAALHTRYLDAQKGREKPRKATDEMSYEAVWQQWLTGADQLRARTAFALGQIMVISNIAPDIRPYAMSSYMDLLNRNAFGNYRTLLREVTLHPAMGYYLNMIESEKDDEARGIHPNENYAREVLQLFSIGLVQLNIDGTPKLGSDGKPLATYGEAQVKGFAKAFSGWTFASQNPAQPDSFHDANEELDSNWMTPMRAFASAHSPDAKTLLNGVSLPAGQTPEKDLDDAIDVIFNHPNVGPFIGRQLIQRLVTSNPSPAYITRVARSFNDNGSGVRGDLKAVVRAVLLDAEARDVGMASGDRYGKQREPVVRFASFLRALGAKSQNGINSIHYLDSADNGLGQSPLLAPSVFNFYSPNFRQPGAIAKAGLYAPEFQITNESTVIGYANFMLSHIAG